jgi:ABC-type lipoprotein release transport system permease subunit
VTPAALALLSLRWYRRTHVAVVLGVATAVSALAGALVVGDSVRGSLRELALLRLGKVEQAVRAQHLFPESLAGRLAGVPLLSLEGTVSDESSSRRAFVVAIHGVDARFWALQGVADPLPGASAREALLSPALAEELGAREGASLLLRIQAPGSVPGSSLYGEREELGRTLRVQAKGTQPASGSGEFALRSSQQAVRALFLPLRLLQRTLKQEGHVNTLVSAGPDDLRPRLRDQATLEDMGLRLRALPAARALSLESASALVADEVAAAARAVAARQGLTPKPLLTYLANTMRVGARELPYSLVTGLDDPRLGGDGIVLSDWAAEDLRAKPGDALEMTYYLWEEGGRLREERARFRVAAVVPLGFGDRDMTPEYPGITEATQLSDWDPPFPVDMQKIRKQDEDYWEHHRGTPKAYLPLARAQELWRHRLGAITALRLAVDAPDLEAARGAFEKELLQRLDPERRGFEVIAARAEALVASRGTTDFDQYFFYFSFFLIVSALLLAGLFFRLGVEQRLHEIGLLRAVGWSPSALRRQWLREGLVLSAAGSVLGTLLALGFAFLVLEALGRFGQGAIGTRALTLHVTPRALAAGALAGIAVAMLTIALTLRGLRRLEPRPLLMGAREDLLVRAGARRSSLAIGGATLLASLALGVLAALGRLDAVAGFFGSGTLSLVALLAFTRGLLREGRLPVASVAGLGVRSASQRPGRSLLSIALIACATFVIVAVGAFRHGTAEAAGDRRSGTGGYALVGESLVPIHYDPGTSEGREQLNLAGPDARILDEVRFMRLRLRPGDDASCLNLYRPQSPRVLGAPPAFVREGRFAFAASLAETEAEKANPWLLLERAAAGTAAIPTIADQNSIQYVLHAKLGDVIELDTPGAGKARLLLVAALESSLFQSELIVAESQFLRLFPGQDGYRVFLLEAPAGTADAVAGLLEGRLSDAGLDLQPASERLLRYLRVENTYIATFQLLGGLGLVLGTFGLATVILRNAAERRRELALLRAVGYRPVELGRLVLTENALLLLAGLGIGALCALVATWPAVGLRGGSLPVRELAALLLAVLLTGLAVSRLALRAIVRGEVLEGLRTD